MGGFDKQTTSKILNETANKLERLNRKQIGISEKSICKNASTQQYSVENLEIFYPSTWQKNILSVIEDFVKEIPTNFQIRFSDSDDKYKIYWIVTNKSYDDSGILTRHLVLNYPNVIVEDYSIDSASRIEEHIRKNNINGRYVIVLRMPKIGSRDCAEYLLIDSLRNGQIPTNSNIQLKYLPLIIVISSVLPVSRQGYIYKDDLITYQIIPNDGKMILNSKISARDFRLEVTERNNRELKKYTNEIDQQRSVIIKQINDFKKEYTTKNVVTANTDLLINLEDKLKHINEQEQKFKTHLDDYFRRKIDRWNVGDYACRECNYIDDYTLIEVKTSLENAPVKTICKQTKNEQKVPEKNCLKEGFSSTSELFTINVSTSNKKLSEVKESTKGETIKIVSPTNIVLGKRRTFQ